MTVSPSQCVSVDQCNRLWWFQKVAELRVPQSKPRHFGTAVHRVFASALLGEGVPKGWADDLLPGEVEACLEFRDEGLARKVLVPRPGLQVEHDFRMTVGSEEMHGVIDVLDVAGVVEDHKVVSARRWARTNNDLRTDIPMMIYGGYLLQLQPLEVVTLRHNQFIQEDMSAQVAQVTVSRAEVRDFWKSRIIPLLRTMDKTRGIEQWEGIPGHERLSPSCTAYGGCVYSAICHKGLPIEQFRGVGDDKNGAPF